MRRFLLVLFGVLCAFLIVGFVGYHFFFGRSPEVGAVCPDVRGEDVEGVPFALSDYRGKVILLDFWGFW